MDGLKMTVAVKQDHVSRGEKSVCDRCAMALAIREADPSITFIRVDGSEIIVEREGQSYQSDTPDSVHDLIAAFDDGDYDDGGFEEREFDLVFEHQGPAKHDASVA